MSFLCINRTFHSIEDLLSHLKNKHPGSSIIGKRLPIGHEHSKKSSTRILHPNQSLASVCPDPESMKLNGVNLSMTKLINLMGLDLRINTRKRLCTPDAVKSTVDNMLENITNSICSKVSKEGLVILIPGDDAEEDYVSERRLFYKGVRDRNQKADREALEKMEVQR